MGLYPPIVPRGDDKLEPPIEGITISSHAEFERIEQLMGDLSNNAGARLMCESYAEFATCYAFRFDAMVSSVYDERLGVRHGAEIGPVFQNFDGIGWDVNPFTGKGDGLRQMSHLIGIMWAGFITAMDPNIGLISMTRRGPSTQRQHGSQWFSMEMARGSKKTSGDQWP